MSYKCTHFKIHELVPEAIYTDRGEKAWELLDVNALMALDALRDEYGSMTVNNYEYGGNRQWSGLRTGDSPYYSATSQHSFGRAFDCLFKDANVDDVRNDILANPDKFPFINAVELGTSWLHWDTRNCRRIMTFHP
jgi:hypothetical protein